jgi:hypothetical protein
MASVYVINESKLISNADAQTMTSAADYQVHYHFASAWLMQTVPVIFTTDKSKIPSDAWVISLLDDPDQADALGYHEEQTTGSVDGKVFARPELDNGSKALSGQYAVSSTLSHEVLELLVDPNTNQWCLAGQEQDGSAVFIAKEVCDPVESQFYNVTIKGQKVNVSNFVTPAWFDPQAPSGAKMDILKQLSKPFTMAKGGYFVYWDKTGQQQQFGEHVPDWRKQQRSSEHARPTRRVRRAQ